MTSTHGGFKWFFAGLTGFRIFLVFAEAEVVVSQTLAVIMMACFIRAAAILDDGSRWREIYPENIFGCQELVYESINNIEYRIYIYGYIYIQCTMYIYIYIFFYHIHFRVCETCFLCLCLVGPFSNLLETSLVDSSLAPSNKNPSTRRTHNVTGSKF